jgi:hypothetical protein
MESVHDESFVVYLRRGDVDYSCPENSEQPFMTCASYGEARQIQRELQQSARKCVIRCVSLVGGGD